MIYQPERIDEHTRLLTTKQVCELLQIHPNTLRRYYQKEGLGYIQVKRGIRFYPETLRAFLNGKELRAQV
jgi:excisionase family DNA binding protein